MTRSPFVPIPEEADETALHVVSKRLYVFEIDCS
jgi:hypothetical protein